jgi:transcriptional regulator with XRE-family HTH domain
MEQEQKTQPLSTSEKLFGVMARLNITRDTLAKLLGTTRTPLDVWLSGTREPSGAAAMLVNMLADLPEAEEWLIAKYEAENGEPLPRKTGRWEHRTKLRAADVCEERAV